MGNCQAVEVVVPAEVVIQHPEGVKVDRVHWPVKAKEIMSSNPGYYVGLVVEPTQPSCNDNNGQPIKNHFKLLKPEDALLLGHLYRLISFEDVLTKKSVKLGKLLKENESNFDNYQGGSMIIRGVGMRHSGGRQWRPALQTIAEI